MHNMNTMTVQDLTRRKMNINETIITKKNIILFSLLVQQIISITLCKNTDLSTLLYDMFKKTVTLYQVNKKTC